MIVWPKHRHRRIQEPRRRRRRRWRFLRLFAIVFAALLLVRALLPIGVRAYVNRVLARAENYQGDIGDLDLNLWRGAYEIEQPRFFKIVGGKPEPLLEMKRLDLSVQWGALLHGRIVAEATLHHPIANFVLAASKVEQQTGEEASWGKRLEELVPFHINRLVVRDGEVRMRAENTDPPVDAYMTDVYVEALNIANVRDEPPGEDGQREALPAEVEAAGRPFGTGEFELRLRFDPLADPLRFDLDASLRDLQVIDLNDFLTAYGSVDAEAGTLSVFAEFAGSEGRTEGYVKTLFDGLQVARFGEIAGPVDALEALWEGLVAVAAEVLENQPHDRLATRIPLRSSGTGASTDLLATIGSLLRNAFLAALGPAIDDSIELDGMEIVRDEDADAKTKKASKPQRQPDRQAPPRQQAGQPDGEPRRDAAAVRRIRSNTPQPSPPDGGSR